MENEIKKGGRIITKKNITKTRPKWLRAVYTRPVQRQGK
jgi:hypothetical protein